MSRKPFQNSTSWTENIGDLIHMDVGGPMEVPSIGRNRYYLLLRDDYSNWRTVYFMKEKSEVKENISAYLKWFKTQSGVNIKKFRSDNGLEEVNKAVEEMFTELGITHERTCPYTPEQNGRAERDNRTIVESARTMLISGNLNKTLWAEATNAAVFILNRTGRTHVPNKTPFELFFNKSPDIKFLKPYGVEVYVHIPKVKRKKWDAKAKKGRFVGYDEVTKGYRVYFSDKRNVEIHRDVDFMESNNEVTSMHVEEKSLQSISDDKINQEMKYEDSEIAIDDSGKEIEQIESDEEVPTAFEKISQRKDANKWMNAVKKELEAMKIHDVWEAVPRPNKSDGQVIDAKWIFKIKRDGEYKARLVARGCFQKGLKDSEIYAPVSKMETIRLMLSISLKLGYEIHQLDVNTAFLHGNLNEEVFLEPPPGLKEKSGCVLKLKKAIYGLKQAPRCWNERISMELNKLGFKQSKYDECLFLGRNLYIVIYVDDILIFGKDLKEIESLKKELGTIFSMKDLGKLNKFLGLNIERNKKEIMVDQQDLILETLEKFGMINAKGKETPMEKDLVLKPTEGERTRKPYRELLGTLQYIMLASRPDISYAVNYLSRLQDCANDTHYNYLLHVLRYLKTTADLKLTFTDNMEEPLSCDVDASWGDKNDRKSTTGYTVRIFGNPIIWKTKKQSSVATSSAEAEYIALYEAVRDIVWCKGLLSELGVEVINAKVFEDNTSCISIATSTVNSKRTKHFDVKYHYVREKVQDGTIELITINSEEQTADIFTKSLGKTKLEYFRKKLNLL